MYTHTITFIVRAISSCCISALLWSWRMTELLMMIVLMCERLPINLKKNSLGLFFDYIEREMRNSKEIDSMFSMLQQCKDVQEDRYLFWMALFGSDSDSIYLLFYLGFQCLFISCSHSQQDQHILLIQILSRALACLFWSEWPFSESRSEIRDRPLLSIIPDQITLSFQFRTSGASDIKRGLQTCLHS